MNRTEQDGPELAPFGSQWTVLAAEIEAEMDICEDDARNLVPVVRGGHGADLPTGRLLLVVGTGTTPMHRCLACC